MFVYYKTPPEARQLVIEELGHPTLLPPRSLHPPPLPPGSAFLPRTFRAIPAQPALVKEAGMGGGGGGGREGEVRMNPGLNPGRRTEVVGPLFVWLPTSQDAGKVLLVPRPGWELTPTSY